MDRDRAIGLLAILLPWAIGPAAEGHDPAKSFADARPEPVGEMKIAIGRNTPTLFGIDAITRFRDPRRAQTARPGA